MRSLDDADGYNADAPFRGRGGWNYRVISWPATEPGDPEGRRYLEIRKVHYARGIDDSGQFRDIVEIEGEDREFESSAPEGRTTDELLIDLKRMEAAVDRPAILLEEWCAHLARTSRERGTGDRRAPKNATAIRSDGNGGLR